MRERGWRVSRSLKVHLLQETISLNLFEASPHTAPIMSQYLSGKDTISRLPLDHHYSKVRTSHQPFLPSPSRHALPKSLRSARGQCLVLRAHTHAHAHTLHEEKAQTVSNRSAEKLYNDSHTGRKLVSQ